MNDVYWFLMLVVLVGIDHAIAADLSPAWIVVLLVWVGFGGVR